MQTSTAQGSPALSRSPVQSRVTRRWWQTDTLSAYLFLSPAYLLFLVFLAGPLLAAVALSLFDWPLLGSAQFIGFDNFATLANDSTAAAALINTFVFTFWSVVLHIGLGLLLALAVNRTMPRILSYFLRTTIFFPLLISWASAALIWKFVLDPNFGLVTHYLESLSVSTPRFLIDPEWALPAIIGVDLWKTIGFTFIVFLVGLQGIPTHLYEAALVDGAGPIRRFWSITIPLLSPTMFFALVITFIGAFQIFEPMFIMTNGGPGDRTLSIVMLVYQTGFRSFDMGYASTLAMLVFVVIMVVTLIQLLLGRRWVHYE